MSNHPNRVRVALVFGGVSSEHEISCLSARSVMDALDPQRFDVVPVGITKDGTWHLMSGPPALPTETGRMPEVARGAGAGAGVALAGEGATRELVGADGSRAPVDVVLPVLHGPMGEDGAVQGMFELADVPYVGAGVLASAVGMDKAVQKVLFAAVGIPGVALSPRPGIVLARVRVQLVNGQVQATGMFLVVLTVALRVPTAPTAGRS